MIDLVIVPNLPLDATLPGRAVDKLGLGGPLPPEVPFRTSTAGITPAPKSARETGGRRRRGGLPAVRRRRCGLRRGGGGRCPA